MSFLEIINVPILEYLRICTETAYRRGFIWVMVLLARERDAIKSYYDLKQYWDSYDDLTGKNILFIMSISNHKNESYSLHPSHEVHQWKKIYNPNLLVVNQNIPTIPKWFFPSSQKYIEYRNTAVENNTNFISELCDKFNIKEDYVPSILLFPTTPHYENTPVIIPIESDNLYESIKNLVATIQDDLREYNSCRSQLESFSLDLKKLKSLLQHSTLSNYERRYIIAKTNLMHTIEAGLETVNVSKLQEAIQNKDIHLCKHFPQPIRGYLNQLIDLEKEYPGIETHISQKRTHQQQLYADKLALENDLSKTRNTLKKIYPRLYSSIKNYSYMLHHDRVQGEKNMKKDIPHFKIGITFSGKYREQFVEPICRELLKLGYNQNDIFYDEWHDALINGVHGDSILRQIYFKHCDCVVVLLSPDYKEKNWTGHIEWAAIKELINTGDDEKICLLRVDSANIGEIDGLFSNQAIAKAIDDLSPSQAAAFIDTKYKLVY